MIASDFAGKLELALKAVSLGRLQLAAALQVDKSVVSRWCTGAASPSNTNLARLTAVIAERCDGFTMLDWDRGFEDLAARLRGDPAIPPNGAERTQAEAAFDVGALMPPEMLADAVATTRTRFTAYEGFWKTTRPSNTPLGGFMHDHAMMWRDPSGLLRTRLGVYEMRFNGWAMQIHSQLFGIATDPVSGLFLFTIFNGVFRQQALILDGLTLTCQSNAGGTPVAAACLMERVGSLSGDPVADNARLSELANQNPIAPPGSIPQAIRDHLYHDIGPTAFAAGGDPLLMMAFAKSLSGAPKLFSS